VKSMHIKAIGEQLKTMLSEKRYLHTLRVVETCESLARVHSADLDKVRLSALLHDCARELSHEELFAWAKEENISIDAVLTHQPDLLHAKVGAILAEKWFGVTDKEIHSAMACHTTAKEDMTTLEKILFVGDAIEPQREYLGVDEIRKLAYNDLDSATRLTLKSMMRYVLKKDLLLHKDSVKAWNWLLAKERTIRKEL
jgi:predicted HD superfamily hydrolase involved in NAD metabolism